MGTQPLAGLRVLVTRPAHQAAGLVLALEDAGAQVNTLPLLSIAPPLDPDAARAALLAYRDAALWIFTSANAVEGAVRLQPDGWPEQLLALGQASARALALHGHRSQAPEGGSSEDLLLWPELSALHRQRVLIVTGEAGRTVLADTLRARGAEVAMAACYRRERLNHVPEKLQSAVVAADVIVLTSGEALDALLAAQPAWQQQALLLPSQRVAAQARNAGFAGPILLPTAVSDAAIQTRLEQWQRDPHNDCL